MDFDKKRQELMYFETFRATYPDAPQGIVCAQERPDFVVKNESGRIGVEVTRCFRPASTGGRPLQEQFALQQRIAELAQEYFERVCPEKLNVQVVFTPGFAINKSDVRTSATSLANAVSSIEVTSTLTGHGLHKHDRGANSVASVYVRNCLPGEPSLWRPATAAWVRRLQPQEIQQEISRKAASLEGYDADLIEVWLLIVADGLAFVELSELAKERVYEAPFARVLFLDAFTRRCTSLEVRRIDRGAEFSVTVA